MNKLKRGIASIKKSTNKKFNTLRKMIWKVKRKKKIKQKNKAQKKLGFKDTSTQSSRFCQYLYTMKRVRQRCEISVKPLNRRWGEGEGTKFDISNTES